MFSLDILELTDLGSCCLGPVDGPEGSEGAARAVMITRGSFRWRLWKRCYITNTLLLDREVLPDLCVWGDV
jgi:hypothetical protein